MRNLWVFVGVWVSLFVGVWSLFAGFWSVVLDVFWSVVLVAFVVWFFGSPSERTLNN